MPLPAEEQSPVNRLPMTPFHVTRSKSRVEVSPSQPTPPLIYTGGGN